MIRTTLFSAVLSAVLLLLVSAGDLLAQTHHIYVAAESDDEVHHISFNAQTGEAVIEATVAVGVWPTETEGPHGVNVSPDGDYWYVSIAHGNPYGTLYKYETGTNLPAGSTELGMFPATIDISTATGLLYGVNFNLHGDMEPSTVFVVDPDEMALVGEIPTGIMPHGSRVTDDGKFQYHVSMMTDELVEINAATMQVSRKLILTEDGENAMSMHANMGEGGMDHGSGDMDHGNMDHDSGEEEHGSGEMDHDMMMEHHPPEIKPTWADPHPLKPLVYVAGNGSDEILEVDRNSWEITRRFQTGKAPYNLEVSDDGKWLVVSYKGEGATAVWNLEEGTEAAKIKNSREVTHGVTISPDSRFAFISVEGRGSEPGSVDIIDLQELERVAVVETGKQAGGIIYWKSE